MKTEAVGKIAKTAATQLEALIRDEAKSIAEAFTKNAMMGEVKFPIGVKIVVVPMGGNNVGVTTYIGWATKWKANSEEALIQMDPDLFD